MERVPELTPNIESMPKLTKSGLAMSLGSTLPSVSNCPFKPIASNNLASLSASIPGISIVLPRCFASLCTVDAGVSSESLELRSDMPACLVLPSGMLGGWVLLLRLERLDYDCMQVVVS